MGKPQILYFLGCYSPDIEATGPNQSFRALVDGLRGDFDFRVVSRAAPGEPDSQWQPIDGALLRRLPIGKLGGQGLLRLLRETPHDLLALNGFHDPELTFPTLVMRRLGLIPRRPTILSPRGEFASGARSIKSRRKRAYLGAVRALRLLDDIWLHATADHERRDIAATGLVCRGILDAADTRFMAEQPSAPASPVESGGPLRLAFLGRIAPVKNIEFAIDVLSRVRAPVSFDLYGPMEDQDYWLECEKKIAELPPHIEVRRMGPLPHREVVPRLADYDLFFLPTLGENFGHAISEALSAGLPILIADTTLWRGLEAAGAGWDISLSEPERFVEAIESFAASGAEQRAAMRRAARDLAERSYVQSDAIQGHKAMFMEAMAMYRRSS